MKNALQQKMYSSTKYVRKEHGSRNFQDFLLKTACFSKNQVLFWGEFAKSKSNFHSYVVSILHVSKCYIQWFNVTGDSLRAS